jgi:acyl-coenzyme A synthetase/AMP-(fatty) acid ligase
MMRGTGTPIWVLPFLAAKSGDPGRFRPVSEDRPMTLVEPPEYFNFAEDVLGRCVAQFPERTALLFVDEAGNETRWSFGSMDELSSRLAHVLHENGLKRGKIALLMLGSAPYSLITRLAVMKAGGVSLLVRPGATARELSHYIDRAHPSMAIAGGDDADRFPPSILVLAIPSVRMDQQMRAASPEFESLHLRSDEPEHIVLTGGTTGLPKLVLHTHGSRAFHTLRWTVSFDVDDLSWDLAGRWWLGAWRNGSTVFDRAAPAGIGPALVLDTLARYPVTRLMAPARLYAELLRHGVTVNDVTRLRTCCSAGQALDPTVFRDWKTVTGKIIYDRYGQSEIAESPFEPASEIARDMGSIGRPFPWVPMAIIDQQGNPLASGDLGDIAIKARPTRPSWLFREYLGDPDATAARHRGDWYLTGDVGRTNADGFVLLAGRADDVINCGGTNIGPWELESALLEHPAVREAAVVGKPHRDLGEIPKAYVVTESGYVLTNELAGELISYTNNAVHPHKRLRDVEFIATLPKTPEGKVRRGELRARERASTPI